jgi:hypothetical protein
LLLPFREDFGDASAQVLLVLKASLHDTLNSLEAAFLDEVSYMRNVVGTGTTVQLRAIEKLTSLAMRMECAVPF